MDDLGRHFGPAAVGTIIAYLVIQVWYGVTPSLIGAIGVGAPVGVGVYQLSKLYQEYGGNYADGCVAQRRRVS
jgi:hypothetical protein